ncbi:MAG: molybdopterin oxidoreductase family protein [Bryobacteraceae bacterium]|nr:molybdopterin oxidoreductase family protein [Bryobacteraceae bacterium]
MGEIRHSVCALDCPDACAILVQVEGGRAVRLRGDPAHPVTQGFLCAKVARYLERGYHPERLLHPLRRTGAKGEGRFERIGWDEALELLAAKLKETARQHGPEAVLPYSYGGTLGFLQGSSMDRRFFHRLGASRLERTICASAGGAGLMEAYGRRMGTAPEDFVHARYIVAWGANILSTNVHLWPFLVEARRRGARFVVIDPVRTKTAALADWHLAPYPGSDLALALGLMHVLYAEGLAEKLEGDESLRARAAGYPPERVAELTGIAAEDIRRLGREYGTVRPAVIRLNYGVQRSERGGRAVRAISLLPAITGSWRERGGGLLLTTSGAFAINREALERPDLGPPARTVNMVRLGEALTELDAPPVKALVVYNSNPAAVCPDQRRVLEGLRREDLFTAVIDHFVTDTARFADLVLPATTFLEHTDLYFAYGHYWLQLARPAVAPPGECRSNVEIFRELARRMGFDDACFADSEDDMIRQALDTDSPWLRGITLERLEKERFVRLNVPELPMDGVRANLDGAPLEYEPPRESRLGAERDARFPLELVSSKAHDGLNSSFSMLERVEAETSVLEMHPEDAAARGIRDGMEVEVFNGRGTVRLKARVGPFVRPGVVRAPATRWLRHAPGGVNVNALISDRLTDIGGGPCFYNCLVEVRRCGPQ